MEQNDAFWDQMKHFREDGKKSTMTFERYDHKNQALEVEHNIIPEFWLRNQKVNRTYMVNSKVNREGITS